MNDGTGWVYVDRRTVGSNQVTIVQFNNYRYNSISYVAQGNTFQVQLWDNGDIALVYQQVSRAKYTRSTYRYSEGNQSTIGIESTGNGTEGFVYLFNSAPLRPYQSFLFQKL